MIERITINGVEYEVVPASPSPKIRASCDLCDFVLTPLEIEPCKTCLALCESELIAENYKLSKVTKTD